MYEDLRRRAKQVLETKPDKKPEISTSDVQELVYELQLHQTELEVQNDELRETQRQLEKSRDTYMELYDFAPIGYLTLDQHDVIDAANHTAAAMLKKERGKLVGCRFRQFIQPDVQTQWFHHRRALRSSGEKQTVELELRKDDGTPLTVRLDCRPQGESEAHDWRCLIALVDITEKNQAVNALYKTHEELQQAYEQRKRAEQELKVFNETLEERIAERTAEVRQQTEKLRALTIQLTNAEQRERKRLSQILHDHIQQLLAVARMHVQEMKNEDDIKKLKESAGKVDGFLQDTLEASRSLTVELSPPALSDFGLPGGLQWIASWLDEKNSFKVKLDLDKEADPAKEETRFLLFECVRELLFNTMKHADVHEAQVELMRHDDNLIKIIVQDEGKGFDPDVVKNEYVDNASFGLFSIQERLVYIGGSMEIQSNEDRGTKITLTAPLT